MRCPEGIDLAYFKARKLRLLGLLKFGPVTGFNTRRPFDSLDRGKTLQQIFRQMFKVVPRECHWSAEGALQLLEEDLLLREPSLYLIDGLLGEEAEFEQSLVTFPYADAYKNGDEQAKKQKRRQRYRPSAAAPQTPGLPADNKYEGEDDQDTKGIPDPPPSPIRH